MGVRRRLLRELLNSLKYIKNLTEEQIRASLWRGEATLYNLELEPKKLQRLFFDSFPCGLEIRSATVKQMCICIPWRQIMTQSVVVTAQDVEIEAVIHCEDDTSWREIVAKFQQAYLRSQHERIDQAPLSLSAGPTGAFDQLRQRMMDGLQIQVSKMTLSVLSTQLRHCPSHAPLELGTAPLRQVLKIIGEDTLMSPCDVHRGPTDKLKDMATYLPNERWLQLTKFIKCRAFTVVAGSCPHSCPNAIDQFFENPCTLTCHITQRYPSDGTRFCPFLVASELAFEFHGDVVVRGCECQLKPFVALMMDVSRLEEWRLSQELLKSNNSIFQSHTSTGDSALIDTSKIARNFARGASPCGNEDRPCSGQAGFPLHDTSSVSRTFALGPSESGPHVCQNASRHVQPSWHQQSDQQQIRDESHKPDPQSHDHQDQHTNQLGHQHDDDYHSHNQHHQHHQSHQHDQHHQQHAQHHQHHQHHQRHQHHQHQSHGTQQEQQQQQQQQQQIIQANVLEPDNQQAGEQLRTPMIETGLVFEKLDAGHPHDKPYPVAQCGCMQEQKNDEEAGLNQHSPNDQVLHSPPRNHRRASSGGSPSVPEDELLELLKDTSSQARMFAQGQAHSRHHGGSRRLVEQALLKPSLSTATDLWNHMWGDKPHGSARHAQTNAVNINDHHSENPDHDSATTTLVNNTCIKASEQTVPETYSEQSVEEEEEDEFDDAEFMDEEDDTVGDGDDFYDVEDFYSAGSDEVGDSASARKPSRRQWLKPVLQWLGKKPTHKVADEWPSMNEVVKQMSISFSQIRLRLTMSEGSDSEEHPNIADVFLQNCVWRSETHLGLPCVHLECIRRLAHPDDERNHGHQRIGNHNVTGDAIGPWSLPTLKSAVQKMQWPVAEVTVYKNDSHGISVWQARSGTPGQVSIAENMAAFGWQSREAAPEILKAHQGLLRTWPMRIRFCNSVFTYDSQAWGSMKRSYDRCKPYFVSKLPSPSLIPLQESEQSDNLYPVESLIIEMVKCEMVEPYVEQTISRERRWPLHATLPHVVIRSRSDDWDFCKLFGVDQMVGATRGSVDTLVGAQHPGEDHASPIPQGGRDVTIPKEMFDQLVQRAAEATLKDSQVMAAREELQKAYITLATQRAAAQGSSSSGASASGGVDLWRSMAGVAEQILPSSLAGSHSSGDHDKAHRTDQALATTSGDAAELERLRRKCSQLESSLHSQALVQQRLESEIAHFHTLARDELRHVLSTRVAAHHGCSEVQNPI